MMAESREGSETPMQGGTHPCGEGGSYVGIHTEEGGGETVTKGSNGGGEVCLGEEMLPCPLQQKAEVSRSAWVEIPVLSFCRASLEVRMGRCLLLSWSSCMQDKAHGISAEDPHPQWCLATLTLPCPVGM